MNMRLTTTIIGLLIVGAGAFLLNHFGLIGNSETDGNDRVLSIVVREGLEADGLRAVAKAWEDQRGIKVKFDALGRGNYLPVAKGTLSSDKPDYDVVFFPGTNVAEMARRGLLAEIKYWKPETDNDLISYSEYQGKVYGLPCDVSTFFTIYRSDLLATAPQTWKELIDYSNSWPNSLGKSGAKNDVPYGLAIAGKAGEELPKIFYPILWSYGGSVFDSTGAPAIAQPNAIDAAKTFRSILTSRGVPADIQSWGVIEIYGAYLDGKVALTTPQWNALYPLFLENKEGPGKNMRIAQIPGRKLPNGSIRRVNFRHTWDLVIPAASEETNLANDFILFATGREGARLYAKTARGNPARKSILSDPELAKIRPEFPLMHQVLATSRKEPTVPFYSEMHQIMNDALSKIISGRQLPEVALQEASKQLEAARANSQSK